MGKKHEGINNLIDRHLPLTAWHVLYKVYLTWLSKLSLSMTNQHSYIEFSAICDDAVKSFEW